MDDSQEWLETLVVPRTHDIGGFEVRRALPSVRRRMVGPFIFWDQMGPAVLPPGHGLDVRPHPHIGLATVTYLFEGEILHRDSVGSVQAIRPGAVNWMTAGRGIVHSERSADDTRRSGQRVFGIQSWMALPKAHEETDPGFVHLPAEALPLLEGEGMRIRLIAGAAYGQRSPLKTFTETLYVDAQLTPGARLPVPTEILERAIYVAAGAALVNGDRFEAGQLLVLRPGDTVTVDAATEAAGAARVLLLGGEPIDGPRHMWWNFVSSSKERIEAAKADWAAGRFPAVPGETEFIPLPEDRPAGGAANQP